LHKLLTEGEAITKLASQLSTFREWQALDTDHVALEKLRNLGERVRSAINRLADDAVGLTDIRGTIRRLLQDGNDLLARDAAVWRAALRFREAFSVVGEACTNFESVAGSSVRNRFIAERRSLPMICESAETIIRRRRELNSWCAWRRRRAEALDLGLAALVNAAEDGGVPADALEETFEAAYCTWWSAAVIGEDEVLRSFSSAEHESAITRFRKADDEFRKLTAAYITARLSGNLPAEDDESRSPSWGLLRRELKKKSRHKPVRQLVQEAPDVITTLAPCVMMSPLSVAQYLPPEQALFDVVIFDEASQITVWDAVGALARGRQAIIAGDPKQMPPTNFFARADDDPDGDVDQEGDLESILDEMIGASIPQRVLNLHYRSRRESLIAFSNLHYYDNSLVTFPAPVHPDQGVRLIRPTGTYARGKARNNQGEAKAIVAEIVRRLTHEDEGVRSKSLGVVTFNAEQQTLIENLLDEVRGRDPSIEWAFNGEHAEEPVFVKNLETVQGDERDVILFSVTYGPDESGHITMNFGPLNRTGGERRLNVAMTRARTEMLVFSTLPPDRIDLDRTSARAVADLKHFLEYAERGPAMLGAAVHGSLGDFESPFETAVARALRDRKWEVRPQIGVSAFRIDLGIVHPDHPGRYLAGVECDGAMYHSSAVARERDKIRQQVLEGLGWTLFRVWSTDWWTNWQGALAKLHEALTAHLDAEREHVVQALEPQPTDVEALASTRSTTAPVSTAGTGDGSADREEKEADASAARIPGAANEAMAPTTIPTGLPGIAPVTRLSASTATVNATVADHTPNQCDEHYTMADLGGIAFTPDPNLFYAAEYRPRLATMLDHVIDVEGPIHEEVLLRRIARHHGFKRTGGQIREIILAALGRRRPISKESTGRFFWPKGTTNNSRPPARFKGREDDLADVNHICQHELRAIRDRLGTGNDPGELSRALGIGRVTERIRARIAEALAPRA
jgi:very-short-patch-repair endonuclease